MFKNKKVYTIPSLKGDIHHYISNVWDHFNSYHNPFHHHDHHHYHLLCLFDCVPNLVLPTTTLSHSRLVASWYTVIYHSP